MHYDLARPVGATHQHRSVVVTLYLKSGKRVDDVEFFSALTVCHPEATVYWDRDVGGELSSPVKVVHQLDVGDHYASYGFVQVNLAGGTILVLTKKLTWMIAIRRGKVTSAWRDYVLEVQRS